MLGQLLATHGIPFLTQVMIGNHVFDYMIIDNDGNPKVLIDMDGLYYHGHLTDLSDIVYEYDTNRTTYCNKIPFVVVFENELQEGLNRILHVLGLDYEQYLKDLFDWCVEFRPFSYPHYSDKILKDNWKKLCQYTNFSKTHKFGQKLIKQFHQSIYSCSRNGKLSPIEGFNNDAILMECIRNRFIYQNVLDPSTIANQSVWFGTNNIIVYAWQSKTTHSQIPQPIQSNL